MVSGSVAASTLPDMPVVPPFQVPPGDREKGVPAQSTVPERNSQSTPMHVPIIPILPLDTTPAVVGARTDMTWKYDGYEDPSGRAHLARGD